MPKNTYKELPPVAIRLRHWRTVLKLTQAKMADRLKIDVGVLRRYENGVNIPGGRHLIAIGGTGLDLNWLLLGRGEMFCIDVIDSENIDDQWIEALKELLGGLSRDRRNALLKDVHSRIQEMKRMASLEELIRELASKL